MRFFQNCTRGILAPIPFLPLKHSCSDAEAVSALTLENVPQVVSQNSDILAPVAVDAVLSIINPDTAVNVDLNDIRIVKQHGGTVDDTELVPGIVFEKGTPHL